MTHIVCCRFTLLVCGLMLGAAAATAAESSPVELARVIADDQAAAGDRIAAMVNLQAQAKKIAADQQAAEAVAPAVWGVIAKPPAGDPKAVAWLVSRGLELLSALPATPDMVTTVAGIVADPSRDLDLRIRAAVALGALAPKTPPAEPADTLRAIRGLAIAALQSELDAAARRRLVTEFSMGSLASMSLSQPAETGFRQEGFGGRAGREGLGAEDVDSVSKAECRRAAWRLVQLADAVAPAKGSAGLAGSMEAAAKEKALVLAEGIRGIALTSLLAKTLPADPNAPQAGGFEAGGGRGGMDGMVPSGFDAVIEAALEEAKALPE